MICELLSCAGRVLGARVWKGKPALLELTVTGEMKGKCGGVHCHARWREAEARFAVGPGPCLRVGTLGEGSILAQQGQAHGDPCSEWLWSQEGPAAECSEGGLEWRHGLRGAPLGELSRGGTQSSSSFENAPPLP